MTRRRIEGAVLNLRPINPLESYASEGMCISALFSKEFIKRGWSTPTFERRGKRAQAAGYRWAAQGCCPVSQVPSMPYLSKALLDPPGVGPLSSERLGNLP